jgi:hypothetical protein
MSSPRAAVAAFQLAALELIESCGFAETPLEDLTINVDFRASRVDVARVSPDGRRLEAWLGGYSIDPHDLPAFGRPVPLPQHGPVQ